MYLMISIFKQYGIIPVFIFDGKPPQEKKELLDKRREEKNNAERKYLELKSELQKLELVDDDKREELVTEMETLKKKFVRLREQDISSVKALMNAYGVNYLESQGEADVLCAYLTKHQYGYACMSDDMDMFVYGCPRVLRHFSVLGHTAILYHTSSVLDELGMSPDHFKQILVLSGTDYNIGTNTCLAETVKWYIQYCKYGKQEHFYDWLVRTTKYVHNRSKLDEVYKMFDLGRFALQHSDQIRQIIHNLPFYNQDFDYNELKAMMSRDAGFIWSC
jgi:5'-3' exonuclease